jgi:hypothetical protein
MMAKFKVGDKVRRVQKSYWPEDFGRVGKVYLVLDVNPIGYIQVITGKPHAAPEAFELVEEAMDLTKIEKPFGLLDNDTQQALKAHGGPYEFFSYGGWQPNDNPAWASGNTYRVQPQSEKFKVELELTDEQFQRVMQILGE